MNFYEMQDISRGEQIFVNPNLICYYKYSESDYTVQIVFNTRDYATVSYSDFRKMMQLEGAYEW